MEEINLRLSLNEVNQILNALGEKSYKQVYQLIRKIQAQAETQLQESPAIAADLSDQQIGEGGS